MVEAPDLGAGRSYNARHRIDCCWKRNMDYREIGFARCVAVAPVVALADPASNGRVLAGHARTAAADGASLVLFPELALTGFTCEDLFLSSTLLDASRKALATLMASTRDHGATVVVGAPWVLEDGRLLNCAFVLAAGRVVGAVPKLHLPNSGEFYDMRWFSSGFGVDLQIEDARLGSFPLASDQLFRLDPAPGGACADTESGSLRFAVELCEDLWAPEPPGARHALAGAELIVNPSASNELVAKADYRRDLVRLASAQRVCAYLYASAGPSESSKDLVFGGHLLAAENGVALAEGERFRLDGAVLSVEFDFARLRHDRRANTTFRSAPRGAPYAVRATGTVAPLDDLRRPVDPHPFVPGDEAVFEARAREILAIQATGLARRMGAARSQALVIGLSGGLDSTLAFLVCLQALELAGLALDALHALTLPGPGTGARTLAAARGLAEATGVTLREVPIDAAVAQHLADLGHAPDVHDVTFENTQARERTQLLFDYANQCGGLVVGTGDLSELALGWCTYNADHMSSYNVNVSVPKTMIAYLVRWYAAHRADAALGKVLLEVLDIPISPELVPGAEEAGVAQHTEAIVGPYELHDFFLYHYLRTGASPARVRALAALAFAAERGSAEIEGWLQGFLQRFHSQQFKRTALPPGPKVGTVSLSPRGDWRMPDETTAPRG